jgi:hypothetical protein
MRDELPLYVLAEVARDKGDFFDLAAVARCQVFDDALHHRLASDGDERLWKRQCMWAEAGASASHWDDDFHEMSSFKLTSSQRSWIRFGKTMAFDFLGSQNLVGTTWQISFPYL